jgi:(2R)-3-sulfolactate dehydrogenase (NADP+)
VGQLFIALSPKLTGGEAMAGRLEELVSAVEAQPGARLPGDKRHEARRKAERDGVDVPEDLVVKLKGYAT